MYLGTITTEASPKLLEEITLDEKKVGQIINFYKKDKNLYRILFEILIDKVHEDLLLHNSKIIIDEV